MGILSARPVRPGGPVPIRKVASVSTDTASTDGTSADAATRVSVFDIPHSELKAGLLVDAGELGQAGRLDPDTVLDAYDRYGAVVIKGLGLDRPGFVDFTETYTGNFMEYVGGANNDRGSAMSGSSTVLTVTGGNTLGQAIPLHGEMFYSSYRPATLFFCCQRPADEDGQTTVCDGVALWNALPDDIRAQFEQRKLRYLRMYRDDSWQKAYKTDDIEEVKRICAETGVEFVDHGDGTFDTIHVDTAYADTSAGRALINSMIVWASREFIAKLDDSQVRWEDGSMIDPALLYKVHEIAESLTQNIDWEPGMVAIVDNRRVMHGRRAYADEGRDIIMRLGLDPLDRKGS